MFFVHSPSLIRQHSLFIISIFQYESWMCFYRQTFSLNISSTSARLKTTSLVRPDEERLSSHLTGCLTWSCRRSGASTEPARTWWSMNVCCEASALNSEIHFRSTRLKSAQKRQYSGLQGFSPAGSALTLLRDLYLPAGVQQVTAVFLFLEKKKCLNLFFSPRRHEHMSTWLTHFLLNEGLWPAAQVMKHRARF